MVSRHSLLPAVALFLAACSGKSPASVADKFVDRYYVEFDQTAALPLTDGVAKQRLHAEIQLVGGARNGIAQGSHAARVYYQRSSLSVTGASARADYKLQIIPQGGSEIGRDVQLELTEQADRSWRVVRFTETTPR